MSERFDVSFDELAQLVHAKFAKGCRALTAPGARWTFAIVFDPKGEPFGRLELTGPGDPQAAEPPSGPLPAIGAEVDPIGLPGDLRLTPRQRTQLATLDREARDAYARTRRGGEPHYSAIAVARDDMDIRRRRSSRAA